MSCNNWNNRNNCGCYSSNKKCECKSEVSDAVENNCNQNMNVCYRQGYAAGFKDGYETGFRDGFWSANGCGKNYGSVMGATDPGCGCK
ncbi:hypothetical protein [Clostridium sp. E02]|uniref:hypothetical protein n=1 Tax=Clostridium sp. E02 TaxID=2487134 RepID=UPI000F53C836|nr:hypothetical protein [Clostridium sp. E02]